MIQDTPILDIDTFPLYQLEYLHIADSNISNINTQNL